MEWIQNKVNNLLRSPASQKFYKKVANTHHGADSSYTEMLGSVCAVVLDWLLKSLNEEQQDFEAITVEDFLEAMGNDKLGPSATMLLDLALNYYLGIALYDVGIKVYNYAIFILHASSS